MVTIADTVECLECSGPLSPEWLPFSLRRLNHLLRPGEGTVGREEAPLTWEDLVERRPEEVVPAQVLR